MDDKYRHVDPGLTVALIGQDISSAFDTVNHGILLDRLRSEFVIDGTAHHWIASYLFHRTFYVRVDAFLSPAINIGVPQESVTPHTEPSGMCGVQLWCEKPSHY